MTSTRNHITRIAVASIAAAGAVGIASTATAGAPATAASHPAATTSSTSTNPVKTRAQIPWASVGAGWVAADVVRSGTNHLVLVSPTGDPYEVATLPKDEHVTRIAADGKHVITTRWSSMTGMATSRVWDMRTARPSSLPTNLDNLSFTRPSGTSVMGFNEVGSYGRYSATGAEQLVKTAAQSGVGEMPEITPHPKGAYDAVSSTKNETRAVALYSHANFTEVRSYTRPAGYDLCSAVAWQDETTLLESCTAKDGHSEIYAQKISGGAPTAVTTGDVSGGVGYSAFMDVGRTSIGTVALVSGGDPATPTDGPWLMKGTKAAARITPKNINPGGEDVFASSIIGDKVTYFSFASDGRSTTRTVATYDVKTKKVVNLAGFHSKYTGVLQGSAIIDPRR